MTQYPLYPLPSDLAAISAPSLKALDDSDPLRHLRDAFSIEDGLIYMDGNSLGPMPFAAKQQIEKAVGEEWQKLLIKGWMEADWLHLCRRVGARIAPLIGAEAKDVIAVDSTSVNIFKLAAGALKMRPGRHKIVTERGNFPTDAYILNSLAEHVGDAIDLVMVERDEIAASLDDQTALLLLTHVHYVTGETFPMKAMTKAAHEKGALVLWDLSHSTGSVPVDLMGADADFAVGCGYKYLNGGPGATAFAYIRRDLQEDFDTPIAGWLGHKDPFIFSDDYEPAPGMDRLRVGSPPILNLSALYGALSVFDGVTMEQLWDKSRALSQLFLAKVLDADLKGLSLLSPRDPLARGSHIALGHEDGYAIMQNLIARNIIGDFREPNAIRMAFTPLYLSFTEVAAAADTLIEIIRSGSYAAIEYQTRKAVP